MLYIYMLIDPDTKMVRYIGQTNNPQKRYNSHISHCLNINNRNYNCNNYIWLRKLLNDNKHPIMDILESNIETRNESNELEIFYIRYFKYIGFELTNMSSKGFNINFTPEVREKMSIAKKGKTIENIRGDEGGKVMREEKRQLLIENNPNRSNDPEVKEKISNTLKEYFKDKSNHWATGKTFTEKHINNLKTSHSVDIAQYDMNMNLIKIWPSVTSIRKDSETQYRVESICDCCKGRISSYKGYIWKYVDPDNFNIRKNKSISSARKIIQYDMDMNVIKIWSSINAVARNLTTAYNAQGVRNCCEELRSCYKGYIWKYASPELSKLFNQFSSFF
jgi:hypothetical protein